MPFSRKLIHTVYTSHRRGPMYCMRKQRICIAENCPRSNVSVPRTVVCGAGLIKLGHLELYGGANGAVAEMVARENDPNDGLFRVSFVRGFRTLNLSNRASRILDKALKKHARRTFSFCVCSRLLLTNESIFPVSLSSLLFATIDF